MDLRSLPVGPNAPRVVHAVIEVPRGGRNKYEYDGKLGVFRLDRVLFSAVHYPAAYGFIPGTRGGDGDPLDILVMTSEPTFTGCLIEARPVGLLRMSDEAGVDQKVLAVAHADPHYDEVEELADVPAHVVREMEHFFQIYKQLEEKTVKTLGWESREAAEQTILAAIEAMRRSG